MADTTIIIEHLRVKYNSFHKRFSIHLASTNYCIAENFYWVESLTDHLKKHFSSVKITTEHLMFFNAQVNS